MHFRICCALAALAAPLAPAQSFYIGAGATHSRLASDDFAGQVSSQDSSNFVSSRQRAGMERENGGRIFAGVNVRPWLALELDYARVGTVSTFYAATSVHGAGFGFAEHSTDAKLDALGLAAVARAPLWGPLSLHGRAGVARTRLRFDARACSYGYGPEGPSLTGCFDRAIPDSTQTAAVAGLGLAWELSERVALRAGWDRYFGVGRTFEPPIGLEGNDARGKFDVDLISVGASYRF